MVERRGDVELRRQRHQRPVVARVLEPERTARRARERFLVLEREVLVVRTARLVLEPVEVDVGLAPPVLAPQRRDVAQPQADARVLFDAVVAVVVVAGREPDPRLDPEAFGLRVADDRHEARVALAAALVAVQRDHHDRQVEDRERAQEQHRGARDGFVAGHHVERLGLEVVAAARVFARRDVRALDVRDAGAVRHHRRAGEMQLSLLDALRRLAAPADERRLLRVLVEAHRLGVQHGVAGAVLHERVAGDVDVALAVVVRVIAAQHAVLVEDVDVAVEVERLAGLVRAAELVAQDRVRVRLEDVAGRRRGRRRRLGRRQPDGPALTFGAGIGLLDGGALTGVTITGAGEPLGAGDALGTGGGVTAPGEGDGGCGTRICGPCGDIGRPDVRLRRGRRRRRRGGRRRRGRPRPDRARPRRRCRSLSRSSASARAVSSCCAHAGTGIEQTANESATAIALARRAARVTGPRARRASRRPRP